MEHSCFLLAHRAFDTIAMMDIEQLTKAQIVLLTLLVSFITSIATGIVTVSLMDQAPAGVTQTINRVVERTVERVIPDENGVASVAVPGERVKEVTVVVKENDLITEAIAKNTECLVRISRRSGGAFIGVGFFVRGDGIIATDATLIGREAYEITTQTGATYTARLIPDMPKSPVALLRIEKTDGVAFPAIQPADLSIVKLGQSVISLSGESRTSVAVGVVTDIEATEPTETKAGSIMRVRTDITDSRVGFGSPLFNLFGEVVGIHTAAAQTPGTASFAPLTDALAALPATL